MTSVRDRLNALAAPLGISLPEEYLAFMERRPDRGIPIRHLCNRNDPPAEWWPATVDFLEADIWQGRWTKSAPNAHYLRGEAERFLSAGVESVPGPAGSRFATERLSRGFWIGEEDGDSVFLDPLTLGVFAWLAQEDEVEQWAASFGEFVARGQRTGRFVDLSDVTDPTLGKGSEA
ncbi:MAG: hypothetical protein FJ304_13615 [Planctomycetes bacterium]|nr:hypothetical protein [Planctomycetota bacterium]